MASIDTWKDGRWRARWRDPNGRSRSQVFATKRDARRHLAKVEAAKAEGAYVDASRGRVTFAEYAELWAAGRDWKHSTRAQWPSTLARVEPCIGNMRLCDITRSTVEACRNGLAEKHTIGTVRVTMRTVCAILRAAHADRRIPYDVTVNVARAPKRRADDTSGMVTPHDVPTAAECLALLSSAPDGWRAAVALGMAGLRIGEVLGVRTDRLALDRREVTVDCQASYTRGRGASLTTPKAEKCRTVRLPSLVVTELRRHIRDGHAGTWTDDAGTEHRMLFLHRGRPLAPTSAGYVFWDATRQAAGLSFRFHSLRHFCASSLLAQGVPVPAAAGYIGDTPETMMRTYAHWLRDQHDVPADVLDGMLSTAGRDTNVTQSAVIQVVE